jgi:hypothetical protein
VSSVFPLAQYHTKSVALASTTKTTIYQCGDQGELAFDVTSLIATASDGTADSVTFSRLQHSDNAEYVIIYRGAVAANYPLMLEGMPIHMVPGEIIYATSVGASAAHPTHIHISGAKTTRTQTPKA